ncbi:hypothetical protein BKA69DRAFT_1079364 [Paraphysoderma sedebokerense]|nr:hypothetical protein BKA69DRAFT_1079364 [Paraphysoderma sedebokerense]
MSKSAASVAAYKDSLAGTLDVEGNKPISSVQIDALVVLKIIKHSRESFPTPVTGALLGLDISGRLEVTNCYPFLSKKEDEVDDDDLYQIDMMKCLREVNVDSNNVGWYQSAPLGSFFNPSCVNIQRDFQLSIGQSVVIEYDPVRSTRSQLSLRAFQLTSNFLELYKSRSPNQPIVITSEAIERLGLSYSDIFQELPVKIKNTHLLSALMSELEAEPISTSLLPSTDGSTLTSVPPLPLHPNFDQLEGQLNAYLEKNLEFLTESLDDYSSDYQKHQFWIRNYLREKSRVDATINRKRQDNVPQEELDALYQNMINKLPAEPSRLETLLLMGQMKQYCSQINAYSGPALARLYTNGALMKDE